MRENEFHEYLVNYRGVNPDKIRLTTKIKYSYNSIDDILNPHIGLVNGKLPKLGFNELSTSELPYEIINWETDVDKINNSKFGYIFNVNKVFQEYINGKWVEKLYYKSVDDLRELIEKVEVFEP